MFLPNLTEAGLDTLRTGRNEFTGSTMLNNSGLSSVSTDQSQSNNPDNPESVSPNDSSANSPNGDKTFSQIPHEIPYTAGSGGSGMEGNVISYPSNLGSANLQHYTKFEVFAVKTENIKLLGDQAENTFAAEGSEMDMPPRFHKGNQGALSEIQRNQVKYTRLQQMIGLPLPESMIADYSTSWSRVEGGMVSGVVSMADAVAGSANGENHAWLSTAAMGLGAGLSNLASQVGMDGAQTNLKLLTKRASNPRNEFLFDGVNNRAFNFSWKFIPKNAQESETIRSIIEKFKLYMYPELDEAMMGKFYIFPAIFDITFMSGAEENKYLYKASSCALTNIMVNHYGSGMSSFFNGTNAPNGYEVTMQFTELEFLHRARFQTDNNPDGVAR